MSESKPMSAFSMEAESATGLRRFRHDAMACTFEVAIVGKEPRYAHQTALAAFDEIDRLEHELSRFIPDSDIARINDLHAGQSLRVGIEAIECLQLAARVFADTGGAFDVTFASRLDPPTASRPALHVDAKTRTVAVSADGVRVDLGGIGKGYALDQVVPILTEWGIEAAVIHSGQSSAYAHGAPPAASAWRFHLRDPNDQDKALGVVPVRDAALSGSGQRLHGGHIIDPRTGAPAECNHGAWALAPTAAASDALATAFMIMTPEQVRSCCERNPEIGAILLPSGAGAGELCVFGAIKIEPAANAD